MIASLSGWVILFTLTAIDISGHLHRPFRKVILNSDAAFKDVAKAKVLRIFASGSQTARTTLHSRIDTISHRMEIQLLIRTDGTPEREASIQKEIARWRSDIVKANITLEIRKYQFDPVMMRGWVIDDAVAMVGWYYRSNKGTAGQGDPVYRFCDKDYVKHVIILFDQLYSSGKPA